MLNYYLNIVYNRFSYLKVADKNDHGSVVGLTDSRGILLHCKLLLLGNKFNVSDKVSMCTDVD